jgi:hypothetical protein
MSRYLQIATAFVFSMLSTTGLFAQHLHQHGGHFDVHQNVQHGHDRAGHLVDGWGHHINGDGIHTGSIGVFENGAISSPWNNYYPNYQTFPSYQTIPSYSTPYYSGMSGGVYANQPVLAGTTTISSPQPSTIVSSPPPGTIGSSTIVANKIPVAGPNQTPQGNLGTAIISNPRDSGGSINYTLNNQAFSINPGESQTIRLDREFVIKFDNGLSKQVVYRLENGNFEFRVSQQTGWDMVKRAADVATPAANAIPSLPTNTIPDSVGQSPPPDSIK